MEADVDDDEVDDDPFDEPRPASDEDEVVLLEADPVPAIIPLLLQLLLLLPPLPLPPPHKFKPISNG